MKRCTKTLTGKHIWDRDYKEGDVNYTYSDRNLPYPQCLACDIWDDRPPTITFEVSDWPTGKKRMNHEFVVRNQKDFDNAIRKMEVKIKNKLLKQSKSNL